MVPFIYIYRLHYPKLPSIWPLFCCTSRSNDALKDCHFYKTAFAPPVWFGFSLTSSSQRGNVWRSEESYAKSSGSGSPLLIFSCWVIISVVASAKTLSYHSFALFNCFVEGQPYICPLISTADQQLYVMHDVICHLFQLLLQQVCLDLCWRLTASILLDQPCIWKQKAAGDGGDDGGRHRHWR